MRTFFLRYGALLAVLALVLMLAACDDDNPTEPIDYDSISSINYDQHVQPLFTRSCVSGCHDAVTKSAGLELTSYTALMRGSTYGEAVVAYTPNRSLLTRLFDGTALRKQHPAVSSALTTPELNFLKRWIGEGAKNAAGTVPFTGPANKLYVPNQGEDRVTVIDMTQLVVTRYVDVGTSPAVEGPHFVAAGGGYWYVSLIGAGEVWKFDASNDSLVAVGRVSGSPALLALTPDGQKLYVTQFTISNQTRVFVLDTRTMTVSKSIPVWSMPHGIRMNHAGTFVYVANMMSDNMSVIDVATDNVVATVPLAWDANPVGPSKYMPMEIAISPDDQTLAVTCSENREVRIFDLPSNVLRDSIAVGDQPWHLEFTANGEYVYVANRRGNSVSPVHLPMHMVMETIETPTPGAFDYPHGCAISPGGQYVFISNENVFHRFVPRYNSDYTGNVTVIDPITNRIVKVIEVGMIPTGIAIVQ